MDKKYIALVAVVIVGFLGMFYYEKPNVNFGGITQPIVPTQAVWAVASSTSQVWTTLEISANVTNGAVNASTSVGVNPVKILSGNGGRIRAAVCSGALGGWITINSSATTTATSVNFFASSTGQFVPANTCVTL